MPKSSTFMCAGLMTLIGLLILPPMFSAIAANAPTVGPFAPADLTIGRSHVLFTAFEQYAQDNDEQFPPMASAAAFDAALLPYVKGPAPFLSADTGKPFQPNAALNGSGFYQSNSPGTTEAFEDSAPGQPTIKTFLDGHVEKNGVETGDPGLVSISRAKALAVGIDQYAQDNDETLPPMQATAQFQAAIFPYARSLYPFTDNLTGQPFVPNAALSGLDLGSVPGDPSTVPVVTSAQAASDGYRTIAYLDGHATHGAVGVPVVTDLSNLRKLSLGIIEYEQDNEQLPPLQNEMSFEAAIFPYVRSQSLFISPTTDQPYLLNAAVSGASLASIADPTATWVIKDSAPNPDGSLNIGYADGHVAPTFNFVPKTLAVGQDDVAHLVWMKGDGTTAFTTLSATGGVEATTINPPGGEQIAGYGVAPDGTQRLSFRGGLGLKALFGSEVLEDLDASGNVLNTSGDGPYDGWTPGPLAVTAAGQTFMLWGRYDGQFVLRVLSSTGTPLNTYFFTFPAGGTTGGVAAAPDGSARLVITLPSPSATGVSFATILTTLPSGQITTEQQYRNIGLNYAGLSVGPDGLTRLLWVAASGQAQLWTLTKTGSFKQILRLPADPGWTPLNVSVGPDGNARLLSRDAAGDARIRFISPTGVTLTTLDYAPPQ